MSEGATMRTVVAITIHQRTTITTIRTRSLRTGWTTMLPYIMVWESTKGKEEPKPIEPSYIPLEVAERSIASYKTKNPLYIYLRGVIGESETNRIFRLYCVGTANKWGGSTVFWQLDVNGNVRAGKIMGYDRKTGHRIKEPQSQVTWAHSELKLSDFHLVQCLFGEHLLKERPTAPVALVESEKTALIM